MCYAYILRRMNAVTSTRAGQVIFIKRRTLVSRRAGMWLSWRFAEKPANAPVTSLAENRVHFDVQSPSAYSTAWSREVIFNMTSYYTIRASSG